MTDPSTRGLKLGHWVLIGLSVLLVGLVVAVVLRRGDPPREADGPVVPPSVITARPDRTSVSPRARPDCAPEIVDKWLDGEQRRYAFVYRNRCDQVVQDIRFRVAITDEAGRKIPSTQSERDGGVLFPGAELAVSENTNTTKGRRLKSLEVEIAGFAAYPPENYTAWARADVVGLTVDQAGGSGPAVVTGPVKGDPPDKPLCITAFVLVARDRSGAIAYADSEQLFGKRRSEASFDTPALPSLDAARSRVYAPQKVLSLLAPTAGVTCDGILQ